MYTRRAYKHLLGGLVTVAAAWAQPASAQSSWYLGASAGQSRVDASSGEIESGFLIDDSFTASGTTLDKSDTGWKAYAGWRFNRFFGAEAGYADLGKASFNTTIVSAPVGTVPAPPFAIHATAEARGVFSPGTPDMLCSIVQHRSLRVDRRPSSLQDGDISFGAGLCGVWTNNRAPGPEERGEGVGAPRYPTDESP